MRAEEKMMEILLKIYNGEYTNLDGLKDLIEIGIETSVQTTEEKQRAKIILSAAKERAENMNNNNRNIN